MGSFSSRIHREASIGTTVKASKRETKTAKEMMNATGPNKVPISPFKSRTGTKTAAVVSVDINAAMPTSLVPSMQAFMTFFPSS